MSLPAIQLLGQHMQVRVICREDCSFILEDMKINHISFNNALFESFSFSSLLISFKNILNLRRKGLYQVLDLEADPRSMWQLKLAGINTIITYNRPGAIFADEIVTIKQEPMHQLEKNYNIAAAYLRGIKPGVESARLKSLLPVPGAMTDTGAPIIISCWTSRPEKNWPLDCWAQLLDNLYKQDIPFRILVPPDADRHFLDFKTRYESQWSFLSASLESVYSLVLGCRSVICCDNFLGHMAASLGRPVMWINGSSDSAYVRPYGQSTRVVQEEIACRPCFHKCTHRVLAQCLKSLSSQKVIDEFNIWLKTLK